MMFANTAIYVGLNAMITVVLGFLVVRQRRKTRTSAGDGGHKEMLKAIRAYGNNTETVPIGLLIIAMLEAVAAPIYLVHALGVCLTLGRIAHGRGLHKTLSQSSFRFYGMILTWLVYLIGAPACVFYGLMAQ